MVKNAYIHIPFCKSKCKYCSFISYPEIGLKREYLNALKQEIDYFYKKEKLNTLYIGGGTPSILSVEEIKEILNQFCFEDFAEITIELNPETLTESYFTELKGAGINRISIGCQTFDDKILQFIGRRHNSAQVIHSVELAKKCGFDNISLDFIYGLPSQSIEVFKSDLKRAVLLGVKHISLYGLKIDEGCYFYEHLPENLPDDDIQADMYLKAIEILQQNNFEHYEVSNFAKEGYCSRHNLNYWNNNFYYGFGIAAHGYIDGIRYSNSCSFNSYFENPACHAAESKLSKEEILEEEIFLGLRCMQGIDFEYINSKFDINFEKKYDKILEKYLSYGHLAKTDRGVKFTNKGIVVSNTILAEFLR